MTLTEEINKNPYLKVSNCTDISDVETAMEALKALDKKYPKSKLLLSIWAKMIAKKKKLSKK